MPIIKKKPERKKIPGKYLLLIVTIICLGLMIMTFSMDIQGNALNSVAGFVIVPFQKGMTNLSSMIVDSLEQKKTIEELQAENAALKEEINTLNSENTLLMQDYYELTSLRELFELDNTYSEYDKVGARIIAAGSGNWFDSFIIDKGSADGIAVDMNVIAGSGLVGIVTEVGTNWARVNTIINNDANVSAKVLHSQDNMVVSGSMELIENGVISFSGLLDDDNNVNSGDKVVTSNISSKYLPGIMIGYIDTVDYDANNMTKSGYITPVVDFKHLSEVLVITELKQTPD